MIIFGREIGGAGRRANRWSVLALLCFSLLLVAVDATVLHIAVPALTAALEPSAVQLLWIIDIYSLVVAPLLVTFGTLGDRYGRRAFVIGGYVVFGVASLAAAFAATPIALILARACLGVGGAMIMPATLSIIRQVFTDRRERAIALGVWGAVAAGGAAVGPMLGGVLVEHFWWGAVFLINVPLLLVALPLAIRLLPPTTRRAHPWDALSAALSVAGLLALAFGLKEAGYGHTIGRGPALLVFALGVALLVWFTRRQRRLATPLLDIGLFTQRGFATGVACVLLAIFAMVGLELMLAQYLQLVLGLSPLGAALRMVPLMVAAIVGGLTAARLLDLIGLRATMSGGLALTALALMPVLSWGAEDHPVALALCFVGIGFGVEVALLAASDTIMASVPESRAGGAAAIEETAYELGAGLGIAVLGTITTIVYAPALLVPAELPPDLAVLARESLAAAAHVATELGGPAGASLLAEARLAFVSGLHAAVLVSVLFLLVTAVSVAVLLPRRQAARAAARERERVAA
ncbi:MFS transporter [Acrocarpospora macrocephala]|uniref:MFS transporter n=1 Tax=Acrocarpospora macrocephala TaxID=150177 RepID=A0A5M3WZ39_9ACTN|nr:MFS transporter [Acrocarpospora macrocephala]GES13159.1 MFS transporter [Acrocarpospora macrocephala]